MSRALALLGALVILLVLMLLRAGPPSEPMPEPDGDRLVTPSYVRAAHWFGEGWPVNFWSTDLEARAAVDFAAIKQDGFNTVVLVVPWPGFAPDPRAGELDAVRVQRLISLVRQAAALQLEVIVRVGFAWDSVSADAGSRLFDVWLDEQVHQGWLDHLGELWEALKDEPNLRFGFFSWEDLWALVEIGQAPLEQRLAAAEASGFRHWLRDRHQLEVVSEAYGLDFADLDEVPIPARREPAFRLLFEFLDHAWIEKFFLPAQQRFPRLSMEIRVDADPIWDGDLLLEWYGHEAAWDLPGAEWTTLYWSPAMGGENIGELLEPSEATERLQRRLARVLERTGARPIFIGQFLAQDFTPGYEHNGRVAPHRVAEFLQSAAEPLQELAAGYGLWTWRDYHHDAIANPEFFAALDGWEITGDVKPGRHGVEMSADASITTALSVHGYHAPGGPKVATVCVEGEAAAEAAILTLDDVEHDHELGRLRLDPGATARDCVDVQVEPMMRLRFTAGAPLRLRRVGSSGFLQHSGMRDADGNPKLIAAAYRSLNQLLRSASWVEVPLYPDGWMGSSFSAGLQRPGSQAAVLSFTTHLPAGWPVEPRLAVSIDGIPLAEVACADGVFSSLSVPAQADDHDRLHVRIESSRTHRAAGDERDLACVISGLRLAPISAGESELK